MDKSHLHHIFHTDPAAYAQWYKTYFEKLYNYGRKFTADTGLIEDCIQEVFLDIWKKKEKLSEIDSLNSYLFASFRYILLKKLKAVRHIAVAEPFAEEPDFYIEQKIIAGETDKAMQQKIQAAINTLTPRQREAIFLRFYEGLSYEEVAAVLDITTKATYKIMARSLLHLKEQLSYPAHIWLITLVSVFDAVPLLEINK